MDVISSASLFIEDEIEGRSDISFPLIRGILFVSFMDHYAYLK